MHGGGNIDSAPSGRPLKHGLYSKRFGRDPKTTRARIDQLLQDPDLLDARRPVALQAALVEEHGLVPDEELLETLALSFVPPAARRAAERAGEDPEELVTDAHRELARRAYIDRSMRAVDRYQAALATAARQAKISEVINAELAPLFEEVGRRLRLLIEQFVPEAAQEPFVEAFRREMRHVMVIASTIGEK
jgi:hypothetical protein